jgi:ABC-type multidrug transport system fused ATPase/permease subunit
MVGDCKKFWFMLTPAQRRAGFLLLGLMLVGMVLETLGISLVIPILALMTNADLAKDYPMIAPWMNRLGNPSHEKLVVFAMLALVGVALLKVLFLAFLAWRQASFSFGIKSDISLRLFTGYLSQPYPFHLQRNSAELIRNTIGQVGELMSAVVACMTITLESLILSGILVLMLVVEPLGTLIVAGTLGLASWGFYHFTRGRILRWGKAYQHHEGLRIQYLQEGLGAAKDVKLLGCEKEFIDRYQVRNLGSAQVGKWRTIVQALPRLWIELLAVAGMVAIVLLMIAQNSPIQSLVPTLGLFAATAFRFMPSVNRLLNAIQNVRFTWPVIHNLHQELCLLEEAEHLKEHSLLPFKKGLILENVSFCYPSTEALVLKQISLSIRRGESVGFIGSTGAGKSTLVDIVLGLLVPTGGFVKVDGVDIQTNPRGWQDQIGYVPQNIFLTDDTISRNVAFGLPDVQVEDAVVWNSLRSAQLEQFVKGLPESLNTRIGEGGVRLSGGQRQRIGIARALYHNPSVLVLDEATSSLDTATEGDFMDAVCALKGDKTLIIVAHRLTTVEHCDYLFKIENGKIAEDGKPSILLSKKA